MGPGKTTAVRRGWRWVYRWQATPSPVRRLTDTLSPKGARVRVYTFPAVLYTCSPCSLRGSGFRVDVVVVRCLAKFFDALAKLPGERGVGGITIKVVKFAGVLLQVVKFEFLRGLIVVNKLVTLRTDAPVFPARCAGRDTRSTRTASPSARTSVLLLSAREQGSVPVSTREP